MKNYNHLNNILYKITCVIMIFFFACTSYQALGTLSHMPAASIALTGLRKPAFLLSGSVLLFLLISRLAKLFLHLSAKKQRILLLAFGCVGVGMQLLLLLTLRPCLQYDALKPVDTAVALLKGIPLGMCDSFEYFSIYPHNLPLTLYIMCIFKVLKLLGIAEANFILALQLFNIILLDFALAALYRLIRRKAGAKNSILFALLCFLNPLLYYYPVFFYTQVLSIPLFVLMITVFFALLDADTQKKRIFWGICFGLVVFFAWKIRFFTLITLIALVMYLFFFKKPSKISKKAVAVTVLSILLSFSCALTVHTLLMDKYSLSTEKERAFPIQHWLMMGLQGDGSFYYADEDFSKAFSTREDRIKAETDVIHQRLDELGLNGLIGLWGRKLSTTWADGYDDYASNLTLTRHYSNFNDWVCGYRSEYLAAYLHIYNCMSWLLLTVCAIGIFRKKVPDFLYPVCITVLGGMIFHLFWEAGEQYSMPFALLIIAGVSAGAGSLSSPDQTPILHRMRNSLVLLIPSLLVLCVTLTHTVSLLHGQVFDVVQLGAIQNLMEGDAINLHDGQCLMQTVTCSRPFNTLNLYYKYYGEHKEQAKIRLRLLDASGNVITTEMLPLENFFHVFDFSFPTVTPGSEDVFTIELSAIDIPENESLGLVAYHTGNYDVYPEGDALLDGILLPQSDIYFEFSNYSQKTVF